MGRAGHEEDGVVTMWLVVPVKSLHAGKSRLAPVLDAAQRRAFMDRLLAHVLAEAARFPGLDQTLVISGCEETRARASELGAHTLGESGRGLNAAVERAQSHLRRQGAAQMLVVPCDLPMVHAEDLRELAHNVAGDTVSIAPDRRRLGTNGLCLDAALDFTFEFGGESYRRHIANARQSGVRHQVVRRSGLAFDIDTPDDFSQWSQSGENPSRAAFAELTDSGE